MRSTRWTTFSRTCGAIEHFFTIYKELEGRVTATLGWSCPREARKCILDSRKAYLEKHPPAKD
ncbi:MAG: inorganic diphosphatase [Acidobacteriota bacterium]|nr:inorganic diphosphatase [Acidobacteriota bacterium]